MRSEIDKRAQSHMTTTHLSGVAIDALTIPVINHHHHERKRDYRYQQHQQYDTTGLNPVGNDLLGAISTGGLSALEVLAASGSSFPPLKAAVVEALAIIGIVKVCVFTSIILSHLSMQQH